MNGCSPVYVVLVGGGKGGSGWGNEATKSRGGVKDCRRSFSRELFHHGGRVAHPWVLVGVYAPSGGCDVPWCGGPSGVQ